MLIAETSADTWSLFPGVPPEWDEVSFSNLRTRAGWTVSARREGGLTVFVEARRTHEHARSEIRLLIPDPSPEVRAAAEAAGGRADAHHAEWTGGAHFRIPG